MNETKTVPGFRPLSVFLIALSLSIGWGIRGNFGHEYGAMMAGGFAAIAACLLSGREDWRRRVAFFGFFGATGWGFGASISYMQVIGYTHSGHFASQAFGFFGLFVIGFLWAALGGAGIALPATLDRERLTALFRPILWVFAAWAVTGVLAEPLLERFTEGLNSGANRHESPLYWFDADWLVAFSAIVALFLFDLWDRRFEKGHYLAAFAVLGAGAGWLVQRALERAGLASAIAGALVCRQGDVNLAPAEQLPINWPQFFLDVPQHIGWGAGLIAGVAAYFAWFGKFRSGASLFLHMAVGWFTVFLAGPVLLSNVFQDYGGFRMTPPRSDDWAGILGVFGGLILYCLRNRLTPVAFASMLSGVIGGLGFSGVQMCKLLLIRPGNANIVSDPETLRAWAHWQQANWHSWLEQSYGFVNGLAIAVTLGLLASRLGPVTDEPRRRPWTEVFSVGFILFLLTYLNIVKNVAQWTGANAVPVAMKAPLFESIEWSAWTWFSMVYLLMTVAGFALMAVHLRRPIAVVPDSWLGKGQLFYLAFLWMMIVANFERALVGFTEQRILTEGVIFVNGILATVLILLCPRRADAVPCAAAAPDFSRWFRVAVGATLAAMVLAVVVETGVTRVVYGDRSAGHSGKDIRFGPESNWIEAPVKKGQEHR